MVYGRVRSALIRQAGAERGSFCGTCKRNASQRNLSPRCQECGFRTRIKIVNSRSYLDNVIRYLERAEPDLGLEEAFAEAAGERTGATKESPICIVTVEEGQAQLPPPVPAVTSETPSHQRGSLRDCPPKRRRTTSARDELTCSPDRALEKTDVQANFSFNGRKDAATNTAAPSARILKLWDIETHLQDVAIEIGDIKRALSELHTE